MWSWIVASGKSSKGFMVAFTGVCFLVPWAVGQGIMSATNVNNEQLETELLRSGRDRDSVVMGRVNKQRLQQYLSEIHRKENTEDRYTAALRGETLTGTPEARIRGGGGTSIQHQQQQQQLSSSDSQDSKPKPQMVLPGTSQAASTASR